MDEGVAQAEARPDVIGTPPAARVRCRQSSARETPREIYNSELQMTSDDRCREENICHQKSNTRHLSTERHRQTGSLPDQRYGLFLEINADVIYGRVLDTLQVTSDCDI